MKEKPFGSFRRAVLEVERQAKLAEALKNINVGDNYKGIVRKIMPYGAFVDIRRY